MLIVFTLKHQFHYKLVYYLVKNNRTKQRQYVLKKCLFLPYKYLYIVSFSFYTVIRVSLKLKFKHQDFKTTNALTSKLSSSYLSHPSLELSEDILQYPKLIIDLPFSEEAVLPALWPSPFLCIEAVLPWTTVLLL